MVIYYPKSSKNGFQRLLTGVISNCLVLVKHQIRVTPLNVSEEIVMVRDFNLARHVLHQCKTCRKLERIEV